jgi:hypothetical protein
MLYVYSISDQTVAAAGPVEFTTVGLTKYRNVTQKTNTSIQFNCPGTYQVSFNGTASAAGTVQLYLNGEIVTGALAEGTSLAFTALIRVNPNCCAITDNLPATLQVLNSGDAALTLTNAALTIVKVG